MYFLFLRHLQAIVLRHKRRTAWDNITGKGTNSICLVVLNTTFDLLQKRQHPTVKYTSRRGIFTPFQFYEFLPVQTPELTFSTATSGLPAAQLRHQRLFLDVYG